MAFVCKDSYVLLGTLGRENEGGCRVQQDFARWDFSHADLRGQNFAGAQLQSATFRGANLQGVNFQAADARGAIFEAANLTGAAFSGALAQGASFRRAQLQGVSFRQALLLSAHFESACVVATDFTGANLEWAWVEGVDFQPAVVSCALFLNVRGLTEETRRLLETKGGFTGFRPMILGRELYEVPPAIGAAAVHARVD
jgi:hypothetical protein